MRYLMMTAGFEDIKETDNIGINIGTRMVNAVTHSGLGCQVYDNIRLKRRENIIHDFFISQVPFDESECRKLA